jgi:phage regulator Rha-like protein
MLVFIEFDNDRWLWYYKLMNKKEIIEEIKYLELVNEIVKKNSGDVAHLFEAQTNRIINKINELKKRLELKKKIKRSKK